MCGINGIIQLKNKYTLGQLQNIVHAMNERIIHRGPDSEGLFADDTCALGMRRLAIIDLQGGNQPIWNRDRSKCIVFNGELYNFKQLKAELSEQGCIFSTNTDTEVVLLGYEKYGVDFLDRMDGMYAFCIYDVPEKTWFLARDRFGEKPLYYCKTDTCILFASELKSLLETGLIEKNIDLEAMSIYFQLTYIPAPYSIIQGVYKLPAASYMKMQEDGNMKIDRYWSIDLTQETSDDYNRCKKKLRDALYTSVEKRMVSDVPLGAFLSGGFDSTIITGIMSDISDVPVDTFTIGFKEKQYDESELAKRVSRKHGTNHHVLTLDWGCVIEDLPYILDNIDEPFADASLIATYEVSKMTKKYVTVALTGDAGDELFAGYDKYLITYYSDLYKRIPKILRKGVIEPGSRLLPSQSTLRRKVDKVVTSADLDTYSQRKRMMSLGFKPEELHLLLKDDKINRLEFIRELYEQYTEIDEQKRTQYVDSNIVLEGDMLAKVDRASMLASLETRAPMLDRLVAETAFSFPTKYKINKTDRKIILKDTFRDLIPDELFSAPKHGFGVPNGLWLENELKVKLMEYADERFLEEQGLFNYEYISQIITEHMSHKRNRTGELWTFFVFQNWYKRWVT